MARELTIPDGSEQTPWPIIVPVIIPMPYPVPQTPIIFQQHTYLPPQQPCAFDNLPPGVYGLVCHCRRCSTWCTSP